MGIFLDSFISVFFPLYGAVGVSLILLAELGLLLKIEIVGIYFTPLVWTGYILLVDAILWSREKYSPIHSYPKDFVRMLVWSIFCWIIFEGFNVYLQNWKYVGLPSDVFLQIIGYIWSFATIFPAVLFTAELLRKSIFPVKFRLSFRLSPPLLFTLMTLGGIMLAIPLILPQKISANLFGLVWIGFIFLLDPINYLNHRNSILGQFSRGEGTTFVALLLSGLCCGVLWEFWNYWATAKWVYSIPLSIAGPKMFEMPLLGYMGFLPFAVECYIMNEFSYVLFPQFTISKA